MTPTVRPRMTMAIAAYVADPRASLAAAARASGVSASSLRAALRRAGVPIRPSPPRPRRADDTADVRVAVRLTRAELADLAADAASRATSLGGVLRDAWLRERANSTAVSRG